LNSSLSVKVFEICGFNLLAMFSYFIFPYEEKKNKESLIDNETKQYFITFTLSIFFISFGICAVRRSFLFNA